MIRIQEKPANKLFEEGPDWTWDNNLKHWHCTTPEGLKVFIWTDWMNPPPPEDKQKKLSKSDGEREIKWDGISMGVPGGPEPNPKQGPILAWLRRGIMQRRLGLCFTPEQIKALGNLKALGKQLSSGLGWETRLATRWGEDPETKTPRLEEEMVLDTKDLIALADLGV